jgi:hypothetical protein
MSQGEGFYEVCLLLRTLTACATRRIVADVGSFTIWARHEIIHEREWRETIPRDLQ